MALVAPSGFEAHYISSYFGDVFKSWTHRLCVMIGETCSLTLKSLRKA